MSTELKIGIVLGIVVVVGAFFFFAGRENAMSEPEITLPGEVAVPAPAETPDLPVAVAPEPEPEIEPEIVPPPAVGSYAVVIEEPKEPEPPAEPIDVEPPPAAPRYHVVGGGETLSSIAQQYYGQQRHWRVIYLANTEIIKDPQKISIGWRLRIPWPQEVAN